MHGSTSLTHNPRIRDHASWWRDERGAAILEFALVLPILLTLVAGSFELGRTLVIRQAMVGAVQSGALYLARVPDPSCQPACTPGAARAVASTLDQITGETGLPRSAVTVTPLSDPVAEVVTMRADVQVGLDLLRMIGFGPVLTLGATHQERRLAE